MLPSSPNPDSRSFADWPRPLAFALSGGGAFGAVQVGMLQALRDRSVEPDLIVGASVGALHGALLASGEPNAVDRLAALWPAMNRRTIFGGRRAMIRSLLATRTLSNPDRLGRLIDEELPGRVIEGLPIPFAAVATDALTGEPELVSSGSVKTALLASAAIPGVFPPVEIHGRSFVDGGIAANVPIRQAIAFGARSVVSLDASPQLLTSRVPTTFAASLLHSATLMVRNQRSHAIDEIAHRYPIVQMPSATPPDHGSFNFDHTEMLIVESYRRSLEALDRWAAGSGTCSHSRYLPARTGTQEVYEELG